VIFGMLDTSQIFTPFNKLRSNLQTKYILFVGPIKLLYGGLRYKVNLPISRMLSPSHEFWGCFKKQLE